MIWRWVIFFSAALWLIAPRAAAAAALTGQVEITNSRDAAVRKRKDYTGVLLWLDPVDRPAPAPPPPKRVQMIQKDKRFTPHVIAITLGSTWDFPTYEPTYHTP
jgi:hypothetical protein